MLDVNDTERRSGSLRYGKTSSHISGNNTGVPDRGCTIVDVLAEASEVWLLEVEEVISKFITEVTRLVRTLCTHYVVSG